MDPRASSVLTEADESPRPWFDHVGIAVWDVTLAAELLVQGLGGQFLRGGDNAERGIRTAQFALRGGVKVELLTPVVGHGGPLRTFLEGRGPGVHHLTLMTDDVSRLTQHLGECGFPTVDEDLAEPGWREAYLGPRRGLGTIVQLGDSTLNWSDAEPGASLDEVLGGGWHWQGARTVRRQ